MANKMLTLASALATLVSGTAWAHPGHDHAVTVHDTNEMTAGLIEQGLGVLTLVAVVGVLGYVFTRAKRGRG